MKRLLLALCALLIASPALAGSVSLLGAGTFGSTPPPSYTGPGDIVSGAKAFWGLRAYSAAVAATGTQKAVQLVRASDSMTCDVLIATSGSLGNLVTTGGCTASGSPATFCSATTCTVLTWYDQSGNGYDATGSSAVLTFSCIGSLPCVRFNGAASFDLNTITATSQPMTMSAVAIRTSAFTSQGDLLSAAAGFFFDGSVNSVGGFFGATATVTASDSAWHAIQIVVNGSSSAANIDGTASTGLNLGGLTLAVNPNIGAQANGSTAFLTGNISELGLWIIALNGTQQNNICHNQYAYWGTSTSC